MRSLYALVVTFMYVQHYVHQQFHWSWKCFTFVTDFFPVSKPLPQKAQKLHKHWSSMPNVLHAGVWSKALIKRSPVCQTVALRKVRGPSLAEVSTRIHWTRFQMVFRGTCVRCTEIIWRSWTKSTALVGTFSTSLEELMHAVLAERASLIWESLCLCLSLIRGLRKRQIICQKCPIDLFRNSLSLTSYSLPGGMEETVSSCSKWTFTASRSSS